MANKRTRQSVPGVQTGEAATDGGSQGITMPYKGGRNATTNESKRAAGQLAPKPSGGAALLGSDRPSHGTMNSMARVRNAGGAPQAGNFLPVQKPPAGLQGNTIGQPEPMGFNPGGPGISIGPKTRTSATNHPVASNKPKRKGLGAAFYGEY